MSIKDVYDQRFFANETALNNKESYLQALSAFKILCNRHKNKHVTRIGRSVNNLFALLGFTYCLISRKKSMGVETFVNIQLEMKI